MTTPDTDPGVIAQRRALKRIAARAEADARPDGSRERSEEARASRESRKGLSFPVVVMDAAEFDAAVAGNPIFSR
jgi:hypothetical protein